jgi:hypothetical protein
VGETNKIGVGAGAGPIIINVLNNDGARNFEQRAAAQCFVVEVGECASASVRERERGGSVGGSGWGGAWMS